MAVFLVDAQLPPNLAKNLRLAGHQAFHIAEMGLQNADDLVIASRAEEIGAILISKDEDFVSHLNLKKIRCPLLWIRFGNTTNVVLWGRLRLILPDLVDAFAAGKKFD